MTDSDRGSEGTNGEGGDDVQVRETRRVEGLSGIAEGTGREGIRESKQFFNIAKGSVYEVVSIAHVLRQEGLLHAEEFSETYQLCDRIAGMLSGLIAKR